MKKPIINIDEVELHARPAQLEASGEAARRFGATMGFISLQIGAQQLGYNITVVPPGKRAFPFHNHRVNEEMFFVLQGEGELRLGGETFPLRQGDIIACPAGGPETAHQISNTGDGELKFLAVSTRRSPEIAEYPDSGKFGVLAQYPATEFEGAAQFRFVGREEIGLDYWDGE